MAQPYANYLQHEDPQHVAPERRCNGVNSVGTWRARPASISAMTRPHRGCGSRSCPRLIAKNAVLQRSGVLDALSREIFVFQDPSKSQFPRLLCVCSGGFAHLAAILWHRRHCWARGGSSRLGAAFGAGECIRFHVQRAGRLRACVGLLHESRCFEQRTRRHRPCGKRRCSCCNSTRQIGLRREPLGIEERRAATRSHSSW